MKYYAKFDSEGTRITSVVEGVHFANEMSLQQHIEDGFIEISETDQEFYITGEYIRDIKTGRPVLRPIYTPTPEEQEEEERKKKLEQLNTEYQQLVQRLQSDFSYAQMVNDTALMDELRIELQNLNESYDRERRTLANADNQETVYPVPEGTK